MKKSGILLSSLMMLIFSFIIFSQEKDIREDVVVVNVEVPVRVMFKGKPVDNLKKSDFKLFENGKEQEINGFYMVRKKIKGQEYELSSDRTEKYKPRYFVLIFRVTSLTEELKKGVKSFITNILRKGDHLLAFINDKTLFFKQVENKKLFYSVIEEYLRKESLKEKYRFEKYYLNIAKSLDMARMASLLDKGSTGNSILADDVIILLRNYLRIWREYKKRYLIPNIEGYYNFSKYLEKINLEKWVISFYQFEKFPEIKFSGKLRNSIRDLIGELQISRSENNAKARIISKLLNTIDLELKVSNDFPVDEISKLFMKVNATFHSLFFTAYNNINNQDLEFKEISTDVEQMIREITKKTGGELIVSNKLEASLEKVINKEDVYYMLTFSPKDASKRGRIKVTLNNKKYKVLYDDNIQADYITDYLKKRESEISVVKLKEILFSGKKLSLKIEDVTQKKVKSKMSGKLKIHILIKDENGEELYDKSKSLNTMKKEISINIGLNWLKRGIYDLMVDVTDLLTGRSAFEYKKIEVK